MVWRPTGADVPGEVWIVHEEQVGDGPGLALAIARPFVTRPEHLSQGTDARSLRPAGLRDQNRTFVLARPTGVGRAISTYTIPIEGRDEWLAAAGLRA